MQAKGNSSGFFEELFAKRASHACCNRIPLHSHQPLHRHHQRPSPIIYSNLLSNEYTNAKRRIGMVFKQKEKQKQKHNYKQETHLILNMLFLENN